MGWETFGRGHNLWALHGGKHLSVATNHRCGDGAPKFLKLAVIHAQDRLDAGQKFLSLRLRRQREVPAHLAQRERLLDLFRRTVRGVDERLCVAKHGVCDGAHRQPPCLWLWIPAPPPVVPGTGIIG